MGEQSAAAGDAAHLPLRDWTGGAGTGRPPPSLAAGDLRSTRAARPGRLAAVVRTRQGAATTGPRVGGRTATVLPGLAQPLRLPAGDPLARRLRQPGAAAAG